MFFTTRFETRVGLSCASQMPGPRWCVFRKTWGLKGPEQIQIARRSYNSPDQRPQKGVWGCESNGFGTTVIQERNHGVDQENDQETRRHNTFSYVSFLSLFCTPSPSYTKHTHVCVGVCVYVCVCVCVCVCALTAISSVLIEFSNAV